MSGFVGGLRAVAALVVAGGTWAASASSLAAQDARAVDVVERAAAHYAPVRSLCATFVQERSVPLLRQESVGRGRLCQRSPDRFAMRFTEPAGDAIVVDGTSAWIYWKSTDPTRVLKLPLTRFPGGFDMHREFLSDPGRKYVATYGGRETVAGFATHRIQLVPRQPNPDYRAATVWIDAQGTPILRRVRIEEENGSVRTVTLTEVELSAAAPAGWFTFSPPAGTEVIGR